MLLQLGSYSVKQTFAAVGRGRGVVVVLEQDVGGRKADNRHTGCIGLHQKMEPGWNTGRSPPTKAARPFRKRC